MSGLLNVVWVVFWGVLVLSVLVFVHEGGHYLAARAFRVRATEFFLGLPCRFKLSRKSAKVGTEFGVTPLLLGGYTRICGMEGAEDELLAPALELVMRRGRIRAQEVADSLGIDLDHAYDLLVTLNDWAAIRPYYDSERGESPSQSTYPEAFETVRRDASLLTEYDRGHDFAADGTSDPGLPRETCMSPDEFLAHERRRTYQGVGFLKRCAMLLAGPLVHVLLAFVSVTGAIVVRGGDYVSDVNVIGSVTEGSFADTAGIEAGDVLTIVDGTSVATWTEVVGALNGPLSEGRDFALTYERDGVSHDVIIDLPDGEPTELLGIGATVATYHPTLPEAASATFGYVGQVASAVVQLIQPQHTMEVLDQSSSVVGIAVMTSEAASSGVYELALIVAAISMSLGFMNLLPIPPFDGGKILIELIQLVIRRPLPQRAIVILSYVGMAFILFVFIVVLRNDVVRLVLG